MSGPDYGNRTVRMSIAAIEFGAALDDLNGISLIGLDNLTDEGIEDLAHAALLVGDALRSYLSARRTP